MNPNYLKKKYPFPEFHGKSQLFDACVVNKFSGHLIPDITIDPKTHAPVNLLELPWYATIAQHQYFQEDRPVKGSVTALPFFEGFDAEAQSARIAFSEDKSLTDPQYKYYQFARAEVEAEWAALRKTSEWSNVLYEDVGKHYDDAAKGKNPERTAAFRALRDPVCQRVIKKAWFDNGAKASEDGTELHFQIECFYNNCLPADQVESTEELRQFARFHKEWVEARGLKIVATELSMFDPYAQVCGTIDAVFVRKDADLDDYPLDVILVDWKRTTKNDSEAFRKYGEKLGPQHFGNPPFDDWQNCTQRKRHMQLMVYAKILQDNSAGRLRVTEMYNVLFHENADDYVIADVPPFDDDRIQRAFDIARKLKADQLCAERTKTLRLLAESVSEIQNLWGLNEEALERVQGYTKALIDNDTALNEMYSRRKTADRKKRRRE